MNREARFSGQKSLIYATGVFERKKRIKSSKVYLGAEPYVCWPLVLLRTAINRMPYFASHNCHSCGEKRFPLFYLHFAAKNPASAKQTVSCDLKSRMVSSTFDA